MKLHVQTGDLAGNAFDRQDDTMLTTSNVYDLSGNMVTETTPDGIKTTFTYDALNRQTGTSRMALGDNGLPVLANTSTTYDWRGNKLTATDAKGNTTVYSYNALGFLVKTTDAMGGTFLYDVDLVGRKLAQVSPQNVVSGQSIYTMNRTEFVYDTMNRLKTQTEKYNERAYQTNLTWATNGVERVTKAYQYDNNGNVVKQLDGEGYRYGVGTTVDARIASGYGIETRYDLSNHVLAVLNPQEKTAGQAFSLKSDYDGAGRKIAETTPDGVIKGVAYDDSGNVTQMSIRKTANTPAQVLKSNTYDKLGQLIAETDGNGNPTMHTYNALGKLRSTVLPGDASVPSDELHFQYDVMGNLQTKTDASVQIMDQYTYDYSGRQLSMTESTSDGHNGVTQSNRYDLMGNKRFSTDGNANTTETTYDALNRQTMVKTIVTDTNGVAKIETVGFTYDKNGNKLTQTDWKGNTTSYTYDAANRLIETVDANQLSIQKLVYNLNNAQVLSYDAYNSATQFRYDWDSRQVTTIDPEGITVKQAYDASGRVTTKTDGNGNTTTYAYESQGHMATMTDALGVTTAYTYDANGNMLAQTDGNGHTMRYEFNIGNLPLRKIDEGGRSGSPGHYTYQSDKVEMYTYTADGLLASKTDRNGNTTQNTYDTHGRLTNKGIITPASTTVNYNISLTYDNNGNRLSMQDAIGTSSYGYDERNRVTTAYHPGLGTDTMLRDQTVSMPAGNSYDLMTDAKGNTVQRTYDKVNRLAQVQAGAATTSYAYYNNGNQQSVLYPNGVQETFGYYKNNLLKTLTNTLNGVTKDNYTYNYDNAGNQTSKVEFMQGALKGTTSFTYDGLNRLSDITEPNSQTTAYTYDAAGNRLTQKVTNGANVALTSYSYNEQNRMMSTVAQLANGTKDTTSYTYDGNGNLIRKGFEETKLVDPANPPKAHFGLFVFGQPNNDSRIGNIVNGSSQYQYDGWNQLVSAKTGNGTSTYRYDGDGQRVEKDTNGQTTHYIYQDGKVEMEVDDQGRQTAWNVQGTSLISRTSGTDTMYYTYNGHADVMGLIDTNGIARTTFDYDAFGNPDMSRIKYFDANGIPTTSAGRIDSPFRYAGYQYDNDTDLYYLNARYYDAETARFISEDTYGGNPQDPLSLNRYTYVQNNPLIYWDYTGHTTGTFNGLTKAQNLAAVINQTGNTATLTPYLKGILAQAAADTAAQAANMKKEVNGKTAAQNVAAVFNQPGNTAALTPYISNVLAIAAIQTKSIATAPNSEKPVVKVLSYSSPVLSFSGSNPTTETPINNQPDPAFGSNEFGVAAHKIIQAKFLETFKKYGLVEDPVSVAGNISGKGRSDAVIKIKDSETDQVKDVEVFEIKPITNTNSISPTANAAAKKQLDGYVQGYKTDGALVSNPGTIWNPNGETVDHPYDPNMELVLVTHYDTDPGLIYYYPRYKNGNNQPRGVRITQDESTDSNDTTSSSPPASIGETKAKSGTSDQIAASATVGTVAVVGGFIVNFIRQAATIVAESGL
jgi:RHS repeat-associated protein